MTDYCRRSVEFADGRIEELPAPTDAHQTILAFLFRIFDAHVGAGGAVRFALLRLRVREGSFREPDLLVLRDAGDPRRQDRYWLGADLVVEIVSPDDPARDYEDKRTDYAGASIPEYWIVDADRGTVTVLALRNGKYAEEGVFTAGDAATSRTFPGFAVDVRGVFEAVRGAAAE